MQSLTRWSLFGLGSLALLLALMIQWTTANSGRLHIVADRLAMLETLPASEALATTGASQQPVPAEVGSREMDPGGAARDVADTVSATRLPGAAPPELPQVAVSQQPPSPRDGETRAASPARFNRWGPKDANAQVELFVDYHAAATMAANFVLNQLLERYPQEVSVEVRQLPGCRGCGKSATPAGTCRAAQAAEAAGILGGAEGFRRMHQWLVDRRGQFSDQQLAAALGQLGFDNANKFLEALDSEQVLKNLIRDRFEAKFRGISSAPMISVNGQPVGGGLALAEFEQKVLAAVSAATPQQSRVVTLQLPEFPTELQRQAVLATVRILNSQQTAEGSGVVVGHRNGLTYVLTASHVVEGRETAEVHTFSAASFPQPDEVILAAKVIARSPDEDLALLRFAGPADMPRLTVRPQERLETDGDTVGQPGNGGRGITIPASSIGSEVLTVGCSNGQAPTVAMDRIVADQRVLRPGATTAARLWRLGGTSVSGRSGGPLVDQQGFILGIASGTSDGQSYYCHLAVIRAFLVRSGFAWLVASNRDG